MSETPSSNTTPEGPQESKAAMLKAKLGAGLGKAKEAGAAFVDVLRNPFAFLGQVMASVRSPDPQTRRMAWLYLLAQAGIVAILVLGVIQLAHKQQVAFKEDQQSQSEAFAHMADRQKRSADARQTNLRLGSFGVALNDVPGSKRLPGVVNMAELEVVVQCDEKSTCEFLEENMVRAKDVIAQILIPMDREDLLSMDGKDRLKGTISDNLNHWLKHGKVKKVFFSRVVID